MQRHFLLKPCAHARGRWKTYIAIFRYFVTIILYCKTIHPVIFFQQHTFFIVYILLYNSILNWFSLTLQSLNIIDFFRMLNTFSPELYPLLVYFYSPWTSMISVFLFRKKTYSKFKVYCKQNRHFYRDFFLWIPDFFNFILV